MAYFKNGPILKIGLFQKIRRRHNFWKRTIEKFLEKIQKGPYSLRSASKSFLVFLICVFVLLPEFVILSFMNFITLYFLDKNPLSFFFKSSKSRSTLVILPFCFVFKLKNKKKFKNGNIIPIWKIITRHYFLDRV